MPSPLADDREYRKYDLQVAANQSTQTQNYKGPDNFPKRLF